MKLVAMTVNENKNGNTTKEIEGCRVAFSFNVSNGKLQNLNARIHEPGAEKDQFGKYLGQVDMVAETGKVISNFSQDSEDFELELALKIAIRAELAELRTEILATLK